MILATLVVVAGCGGASSNPDTTATPPSTVVARDVIPVMETAVVTPGARLVNAPVQKILWGKIWNCGCHDRDGADSVAAELEFDHLPSDFKTRLSVGQYDYFEISFDPALVNQDLLEKAIKTAGGKIVSGPPAFAM